MVQPPARAFKRAIRITEGDVPGLGEKWKHGYGRWVPDILVWTKSPFLFRNQLALADAPVGRAGDAKPASNRRTGGRDEDRQGIAQSIMTSRGAARPCMS
jgi:hypothetical protein